MHYFQLLFCKETVVSLIWWGYTQANGSNNLMHVNLRCYNTCKCKSIIYYAILRGTGTESNGLWYQMPINWSFYLWTRNEVFHLPLHTPYFIPKMVWKQSFYREQLCVRDITLGLNDSYVKHHVWSITTLCNRVYSNTLIWWCSSALMLSI